MSKPLCRGCWRRLEHPALVHGTRAADDKDCVAVYWHPGSSQPKPRRLRWRCECCARWFCWCDGAYRDDDAFNEVCDACWSHWTDRGEND